ncbi:hypothetical protein DMB66_55775 [Actinoplanes sp. ATCC 53533]|uniref:hypothetical protein n=1 Tax=Actinoplanes sp. ATCC 53533 TaxID=1288362 RepID=UPI000F776E2B|nr:hypothetical protein [Actinoplanes sp. ATCC 53533]RSM41558.1 hypothetical protein DMB66_55775 [Actinoplanes sp. ATCC 53533]
MGTIQDPNPDREWLKRSYVDTSTNPFSIEAQTEMMGRLAEGTGGSPTMRRIMRIVAVLALIPFAVGIVLAILDLVR